MSRPCPNCGADVPDDTTFCPECGGYVAWDAGEDGEAEAESPRMPGEDSTPPPPPPAPDDTTEPPPAEPETVTCGDCGQDNPATRSLCQRCGNPLHAAPAPAPPPPSPASSGPPRGLWIGLGLLLLLGVVVLGVVLLTGGDDDPVVVTTPTDDETVATAAPSPTAASPSPSPTEAPLVTVRSPEPSPAVTESPFFANTEPDTEDASGTGTLREVVVTRGPGYDEIAFDVDGPGLGWLVEYVEDPNHQASGEPVGIDGDTVLRVQLRAVEPPEGDSSPGGLQLDVTDAMVELVTGEWHEGTWEFFVGLDGPPRPFRMIPDDEGGGLLQVDTTGAG